MSKENRPAFFFYASDWLTSTAFMDAESRGMYINLLAYQWVNGELPNDLPLLCRLAGVDSASSTTTSKLQALIKQKFKQTPSTCLINERLERVRAKESATAANLSERGRKGAAAKKANALKKQQLEAELSALNNDGNDLLNSASSSACDVLAEYEHRSRDESEIIEDNRGVQGGIQAAPKFDGLDMAKEAGRFIEVFGVGQKRFETESAFIETVAALMSATGGGMGYRARDACTMLQNKAAQYRAFCVAVNQIQLHPPKWLRGREYMTDWLKEEENQQALNKKKENGKSNVAKDYTDAAIKHANDSGL